MKIQRAASSVQAARPTTKPPVWTRTFVLVCVSHWFAYFHHGLLAPTVPLYVTALGGSELVVGLVVGAFAVSTFAIRPIVGYLTDNWSAVLMLAAGGLLLAVGGVGLLLPSVLLIAAANFLRGVGWAAVNTGGNVLVAHDAPPSRRGEATGYMSFMQQMGIALGPPVALWLAGPAHTFSLPILLCAAVSLLCGVVALPISREAERAAQASAHHGPAPDSALARLYDRDVVLASVLLGCLTVAQPAVHAFLPLYAQEDVGIPVADLSWYYIVIGVLAIVWRFALGGISDRLGRGRAVVVGLSAGIVGLVLTATATNLWGLMVGGVIFAAGQAIHAPATMALAIDRANPARRGAAMATYSMAYGVGNSVGAVFSGALVEGLGYRPMYWITMTILVGGLALVAANRSTLAPRPRAAGQ
jgi:MFS family permease